MRGRKLQILQLLDGQPGYGLDLAKRGKIPEGTVYRMLHSLRRAGLVSPNPFRHPKVYDLTPLGRQALSIDSG